MKKLVISLIALSAFGCSQEGGDTAKNEVANTSVDKMAAKTMSKDESSSSAVFTADHARENLQFAKNQYLKLISNLPDESLLHKDPLCTPGVICFPRAQEKDKIDMERPEKWTNGFYQGVLWKLLTNKEHIAGFTPEQEKMMYDSASYYQEAIKSEARRGDTHDLGFLLYDSFGEALEYEGLTEEQKSSFEKTLDIGRDTLVTRYSDKKGVIRSWDFIPEFTTEYIENGEEKVTEFTLRSPWQYPVIVDNMLNLEFLLTSDNKKHHEIAYTHALNTYKNHYYYADTDEKKQYPIAYHVFDYGEMKPGNWQGIGNISAWARGQAWSLYGFTTVAEAAKEQGVSPEKYMDYQAFTDTLFGSIEHFLKDEPVPEWDFFASREDAAKIASNSSPDTARYSYILNLCERRLDKTILPYKGWGPIQYDAEILSDETIAKLKTVKSVDGEPLIQDGKVTPCGTKPYDLAGRTIPKDTSAASIFASAAYRLAQASDDAAKKKEFEALGDKIMAEITNNYLTSKDKDNSYDLGFIVEEATGNVPSYSEVATPIIYGDFYFVEANIRKLALSEGK